MVKVLSFFVAIFMLATVPAEAGGFKESRSWQFEDPIVKALRLQKLYLSQQKKHGLGSSIYNTNYNTFTGAINNADIDTYQSNVNIQNQIVVSDSDYVNVTATQNGDEQTATNINSGGDSNVTP